MTGGDARTEGAKADEVDVSILVVGYNSAGHLPDCLSALPAAIGPVSAQVVFTNNGSDGSETLVEQRFPEIAVAPSRGNIGFARANNYLARLARGRHILLLNPDTIARPGSIATLVASADQNPSYGILGGLSLDPQGREIAMSRLEFPSLRRILRGMAGGAAPRLPTASSGEPVPVDAASGGFLLVRREIWDRLGGLDERFFLYAEELDLCRRLHDIGGRVGIVPEARIVHDIGSGNASSPTRILYSLRGIASYYRKHFSPAYAAACLAAHWASCGVRLAAGIALAPFSENKARLARAMRVPVLQPWRWMRGWPPETSPPGASPP